MAISTTRLPKYHAILESLREEISKGAYDVNRRLPSESELVERFGVSRPTAARALRELQYEGLIDRRAGSGSYLRKEVHEQTRVFGLIVPALGNTEIFDPICAEIARAVQANRAALLWGGSSHHDFASQSKEAVELCQRYVEQKVSGVFFAPVELTGDRLAVNRLVVDALEEAKIPLVLLDRDISEFPRRSKFDLIGIDNFAAGYQLAQHLVNLGCKRISFLAKPNSAQTIDLRIAGWREAMIRTGLECGPNRVRIGDPEDTAFVRTLVKANDSEAVICANDFTAAALMRSLLDLGVRVPQDIRLAGFDDLKYATLLSVRLTTMHQPCRSIGAAAVQAMLRRIKDPQLPAQEILFAAELVVRESCGANLPQKRK